MSPPSPAPADRQRLSLDLAPSVTGLLEHVANVTGVPKSQLAVQALLDSLPALLERADGIQKRFGAMQQQQKQGGGRK